ncbi:MAG: hypothetical protein E2O82_05075 [Betaproteobacteria bacterium]|nr:MAG: hypothetical protein E2O82_05075 [Betaproteobacteria bacterium]
MWLELLTSAAGGGILGVVGAGIKTFTAYKEKKLTFAHEVSMAEENRLSMTIEMELARVQGTIDLELQESESDAKNLTAAIEAEASTKGASPWVQDLKASTRPFLTYGLVICTFGLVAVSPENQWANEFIFLATTAVTFWFGDRPRRVR